MFLILIYHKNKKIKKYFLHKTRFVEKVFIAKIFQVSLVQWLACWTSNPKVPGSIPGGDGTKLVMFFFCHLEKLK